MNKNKRFFRPMTVVGLFALFIVFMGNSYAARIDFNIASQTSATPLLNFDTSILTGTNIVIGNVIGQNTAKNSGSTLTCVSCVLNFDAEYKGMSSDGTLKFGSTAGIVTVTGKLYDGENEIATETLLSGQFEEASLSVDSSNKATFSFGSFTDTDTKNGDLLDFYGFASESSFEGGLNILFDADLIKATLDKGFSSNNISGGSITNTPVPIPAAALLFAPAFLGVAAFSSFRRKKSKNNDENSSDSPANKMLLPA